MTRMRSCDGYRRCIGLITLLLAVASAGCSNGDGSSAPVPTVSSTSPANAATGVAINTGFAVTFSVALVTGWDLDSFVLFVLIRLVRRLARRKTSCRLCRRYPGGHHWAR